MYKYIAQSYNIHKENFINKLNINYNMKLRSRAKALNRIIISREEYKQLKKRSEVDWNLVNQIKRSLEDIKKGRINEWKPIK